MPGKGIATTNKEIVAGLQQQCNKHGLAETIQQASRRSPVVLQQDTTVAMILVIYRGWGEEMQNHFAHPMLLRPQSFFCFINKCRKRIFASLPWIKA
jgi:hypothetical protein